VLARVTEKRGFACLGRAYVNSTFWFTTFMVSFLGFRGRHTIELRVVKWNNIITNNLRNLPVLDIQYVEPVLYLFF
jgi:hypothetical protein